MPLHLARFFLLLALLSLSAACAPAVGDECASNLECDTNSGSICDVSVPGGYCTVSDCVPNGCPDDSVCVRFDDVNAYCMKGCQETSECREEHICRDVGTYGDQGYGFCYVEEQ